MTSTPAAPRATTRRRTPIAAFALSRRIVGDCLRASCPSSDGARRYTQTIPVDPAQPVTCTCRGYVSHRHCYHAEGAAELGERFRENRAVQAPMATGHLELQRAWLAPESVGAVSTAWLCAGYVLDARQRAEVAA